MGIQHSITCRREGGFTLPEMMAALAILGIILLVLGSMLWQSSKITADSDRRFRADAAARTVISQVESSVLNANEFELACSTEIIFRTDRDVQPGFSPYADLDGDGILDLYDPDDDGDATLIVPPTAQWRIGYDINDDDENADNQVDLRWRIRFLSGSRTLYLDYSVNNETWGSHDETLLSKTVSTPPFTFYGSKNTLLCPTCSSTDTNSDGIISMAEIDAAANGGNGNGCLDTSVEREKIVTVGITLGQDEKTVDSAADSVFSLEVMPPLLYIKRRF